MSLGQSATVAAGERSPGLQPYLYNPPAEPPRPAEIQGARSYRNKMQGEERRLERGNSAGNLRELNRVRREVGRVNEVVQRPVRADVQRRTAVGSRARGRR